MRILNRKSQIINLPKPPPPFSSSSLLSQQSQRFLALLPLPLSLPLPLPHTPDFFYSRPELVPHHPNLNTSPLSLSQSLIMLYLTYLETTTSLVFTLLLPLDLHYVPTSTHTQPLFPPPPSPSTTLNILHFLLSLTQRPIMLYLNYLNTTIPLGVTLLLYLSPPYTLTHPTTTLLPLSPQRPIMLYLNYLNTTQGPSGERDKINQNNQIMRNKPNFQKVKMFIIAIMTSNYNEK